MPINARVRFARPENGEGRLRGRVVALLEEGESAWEKLSELVAAACGARRELRGLLREVMEDDPYLALAIAVAGGYVLGGGLPRWAMRLTFDAAGRMAGMMLAERLAAMSLARPSKPAP